MTETELPIWSAYMEKLMVLGGIPTKRSNSTLDLQEWSPTGDFTSYKVVEDPHGWNDQMCYIGNYYCISRDFDDIKLMAGEYEQHEVCAIHPRCIQAIKLAYDVGLKNIRYCRDAEGQWYFKIQGSPSTATDEVSVPIHLIPGLYQPGVPTFA